MQMMSSQASQKLCRDKKTLLIHIHGVSTNIDFYLFNRYIFKKKLRKNFSIFLAKVIQLQIKFSD